MNILECAASLIDDEILTEGELKTAFASVNGQTNRFFDVLERPATKIMPLPKDPNKPAPNMEVIRAQFKSLSHEFERGFACKNNKFATGLMKIMEVALENLENGDSDYLYAVTWPGMLKWIKENAERISANASNEAVLYKLAGEYMTKVAEPSLKKFKAADMKKQRVSARANVKTMLDNPEFQSLLKNRSEGRFDIIPGATKSRPPVIIDNEKKLTLCFRNYEDLNSVLAAKDEDELYNVVKNQFDSPAGIYNGITMDEIPEGIEFQYQNDAILACDWSLKDSILTRVLSRGTYYLSGRDRVVLFANNGESLRSEFDAGEEESRYVNEFDNRGNELYIALNRNDKFNKMYMKKDAEYCVFEIKQSGNSQTYVSRGTYTIDDISDDRIKYTRLDTSISRSAEVAESVMDLDTAMEILSENNYTVDKSCTIDEYKSDVLDSLTIGYDGDQEKAAQLLKQYELDVLEAFYDGESAIDIAADIIESENLSHSGIFGHN